MTAQVMALIMALAGAGQTETWKTFTPPGRGFTIQAPGTEASDPGNPTKVSFLTEDSVFMVQAVPLEARLVKAVAEGNQAFMVGYMTILRDELVKSLGGTVATSSALNFDGYPSILFSASGSIGGMPYEATWRMVITDEHLYQVSVVGTPGKPTKADIDR